MKKLLILSFISIFFTLICCDQKSEYKEAKSGVKVNGHSVFIIEIDSCEYLTSGVGYSATLTHKGNCKYCKLRNSH